ncbi:uncharacterized protein A4U43_C10F5830 [Asparagus officinalis]|uniref:Uncharacterized protein n=1 Tax=Asparagus officinalis TaxID=4686 RepID=A0A5P1E5G1_ASPOF|nr:uncharacterized protein A4U43_C10F5830 [Asparagus officinalis]
MDLNHNFSSSKTVEIPGLVEESSPCKETTALAVDAAKNRAQAGESTGPSSRPESSRCPGKEPVGIKNIKERAGTPPDHEENGASERIMGEMSSAGIHRE